MHNGKWKMEKFTRGAFVRCFLSSLISRFVTANLLSCSRSLQTLGPLDPLFLFLFLFSSSSPPSPALLSSFLSQQFARHRRRSWWKKRGGLNLKNVGQKDGNEVNALTKEKNEKSMEISWNVCLNWFGFSMNKTIFSPFSPLCVCCTYD